MIAWQPLDREETLAALIENSYIKPQIILKHSISCPTSAMAKSRLDRSAAIENADFYLLDLWNHREMSNLVAHKFAIRHESPQLLVIHEGQCIYNESHYGITAEIVQASIAAI